MSEYSVTVTQDNAYEVIVEGSQSHLVVVDFWADWCEPCKTLMPLLEKLASEYAGQFVLAKVNADEEQNIATQFRVQSLPTIMLVKDGQPIDGFTGAQPENVIRQLLDKHLPKPWDALVQQAQTLLAEGNVEESASEALGLLRQAYTDSNRQLDITFLYAQVLIELNRCDEAEAVLAEVRMVDQDAQYEQLKAQLGLRREAASSGLKYRHWSWQQLADDEGNLELLSCYQIGSEVQRPRAV